ncbi:predicted protein [Postia placenta Mad-698-R]|uniref:UspA domain-containing protein n=1 Tax=Postia placenta MAD-698-R-SB12 TaxID=670580 RepID=A0A1X6MU53_9APHY|nr:hypothetical protein POSPLADRAFT_1149768 [Postia placenta MAD-698-R-SB12]EED85989.1 predicted protein [Postia placenta Mad-698-R]OSX59897.1 hypothetical protein POSPLADRAFT_1149768 [Postia placenta MAD-698-R-SB12]
MSYEPSDPRRFTLENKAGRADEAGAFVSGSGKDKDKDKDAPGNRPTSGSFSRRSLSSVMGGLSSLSLRSGAGNGGSGAGDEKERGRSKDKSKPDRPGAGVRSSSFAGTSGDAQDAAGGRTRSQSPFRLRRARMRDPSPAVEALSVSDAESDSEAPRIRPRNAFSLSATSDDESGEETEDDEGSEESWSDDDQFDQVTERNTERNALIPADLADQDVVDVPDPLGEGVNVVVPPEPYFPSTLNHSAHNTRRRKSTRPDPLPLDTSRPIFQRDRCTITLIHGDPGGMLEETGRRSRRYVLASDLSDESRYALEWGIGTVLRDGDEMLIVTVIENENKIDPLIPNPADRAAKLRSQQERQALAYILVRQATSLLQRTRLHVTISCQAWHAKNSRHMLLDIVDFVQPSMLVVGSRGLGKLKGILLGSTSHYLIQKCSVPVMVARRRLKRPPRRSAHLAPHRARVSLAQAAGIDRMAPKVDQDVQEMRTQIERDDEDRRNGAQTDGEDDPDTEVEGEPAHQLGTKVRGE